MNTFNPEKFLIFLVDDVSANLKILITILEREGYATSFATSGEQGLERAQTVHPDLILLDLMMPGMDGLEVCRRLKADSSMREIPIIFLTASHEQKHLLKAFELGAVDYVTKPFKPPELLARVRTHLALKQAQDDLKDTLVELVQARDTALEEAQFRTQFLANMSHELRTPMNAMLGMTEIVLKTDLDSQQRDFIETFKSGGESLLAIVNDILDFSKLEAGAMELVSQPFDLEADITNLRRLFSSQAEAKGLQLNSTISPNVPKTLIGDSLRLRQILTNLIGNAIKFTETGEVVVAVSLDSSTPSSSQDDNAPISLHFSVKDTGIGITADQQPKLFQNFSQVNAGISHQYGGTGLGLSICKQLVKLMGGEIGVNSTPGKGSTFWFTTRFQLAEAIASQESRDTQKEEATETPSTAKSLEDLKILLADDTRINQKVLLNQLRLLNCSADCVNNGQEVLEKVAESNYDIILMDCQMPIMDGLEATQALRNSENEENRIIVVGLTAYATERDQQKCLAAGMNDYLSKPVSLENLRKMLEKWSLSLPKTSVKPASPETPSPAPMLDEEIPVDLKHLHQLTNSNEAFERQLLQEFVKETKVYITELETALEVKDVITLLQKTHKIIASSLNLGVRFIPTIAKKLQMQALAGDLTGVSQSLPEMKQVVSSLEKFTQSQLSARRSQSVS